MPTSTFPCPSCGAPCAGADPACPGCGHLLRAGRVGKYAIRREIARGACGIVYEADDTELRRRVALKVLREGEGVGPNMVKRFHREAVAAAKLRHPNIVAIHDVGVDGLLHYFAMDFIDGTTFGETIRAKRPVKELAAMLASVARAVDAAHHEGIIHRDLKPGNILVDRQGRVFVTDFGLARFLDAEMMLTRTGTTLGTPHYMPPEQVAGKVHETDARSDVYSLGVILYEILTGAPPFVAPNSPSVFEKIRRDEPVDPRSMGADRDLAVICMRAIEKDPARRFPTALAFAKDIERAIAGEPIEAKSIGWGTRLARKIRRHPVPWVVGAAVVLAAAGVAAIVHSTRLAKTAGREKREAEETRRVARAWVDLSGGMAKPLERTQRISRRRLREPGEIAQIETEVDRLVASVFAYYPDAPIAYAWRGWFRSLAGDPRAVGDLDRACGDAPDEPFGFFFRGRHYLTLYDRATPLPLIITGETAEVRFDTAARGTPESREWKRKALEDLRRASQMKGWINERETHGYRDLSLGIVALHEGRFADAEAALAEVGDETRFFRGMARYLSMRFEAAAADFLQAAELSPGWVTAHAHRAEALYARAEVTAYQGKDPRAEYREALQVFEAIPELQMDELAFTHRGNTRMRLAFAAALNNRGNTYYHRAHTGSGSKADLHRAIEDFDRAIEKGVGFATAWNGRGLALWDLGKLAEALESFTRALEHEADYPEALLNRGSIHFEMGEAERREGREPRPAYDKALAEFGKALDASPNYASACTNRAATWLRYGEADSLRGVDPQAAWERGLKDADRALKLLPDDPPTLQIRGFLHYERKEWAEAAADFERLIRINPRMEAQVQPWLDEARKRAKP